MNTMRPLHIIMPMAGEGSRFVREGWTTPKPLIEVGGVPLFLRALSSVAGAEPVKHSFIIRQEHAERFGLERTIKSVLPDAGIFAVRQTTRGAVESCLLAESALDSEDAVLVMDCDLEFRSADFAAHIEQILALPAADAPAGGVLVSFDSDSPRYSYAAADPVTGNVIRVAEKEVISRHALCGAYFFASSDIFLNAAHRLAGNGTTAAELYVSLLYNLLLADGLTVSLTCADEYRSYGTPEELTRYAKQ